MFTITGSDSETSSGSNMKPHPGDCAAPLEVLEWLDIMDEKIETTSYGQVRRGQIPAALLRSTEPKDLSAMPPLTVTTGVTQADVEKRATYIALTTAELDAVRLGGGVPTSTAPLVSMMRTWCGAAPPPRPPPPPSPPPPPPSPPLRWMI